MSKFSLNRVGLFAIPFLAALLMAVPVSAQEKGSAKAPAKAEKKDKAAGRLPMYYGQVVTKEQREKIYSVQAKFTDQILKLREQIELLEMQQKQEVEAVLSADQRQQVAKLVEDAKSRRSKKSESTTEEGETGSTP